GQLALVEGAIRGAHVVGALAVQCGKRDLRLPGQQPADHQVAQGHEQAGGVQPGAIDLLRALQRRGGGPGHRADQALDVAGRAGCPPPSPPSPAAKPVISASSARSAVPSLRRILRKNRSRPWIAVVPSYRLSILAPLMYCSIG